MPQVKISDDGTISVQCQETKPFIRFETAITVDHLKRQPDGSYTTKVEKTIVSYLRDALAHNGVRIK